MKTAIASRKMELTDGLRDYIEKRVAKLDKFFGDDADAKVTVSVEKNRHRAEATIFSHNTIFRVDAITDDMYKSVDKAVDDIERKIRKNKTKIEKKLKNSGLDFSALNVPDEEPEEEKEFKIVKRKMFDAKPMSAEEAILQMNLIGHEFFVYKDDKTDITNIVYKRKDGDYGVIEVK